MSVKWLNVDASITEASDEQLKRALITCDGNGRKFKEKVLDEIIKRDKK